MRETGESRKQKWEREIDRKRFVERERRNKGREWDTLARGVEEKCAREKRRFRMVREQREMEMERDGERQTERALKRDEEESDSVKDI